MADRETTRDRLTRIAVEHGWTVAYSDPSSLLLARNPEFIDAWFTTAGRVSPYTTRQGAPGSQWQQMEPTDKAAQVEAWLTAPKGGES